MNITRYTKILAFFASTVLVNGCSSSDALSPAPVDNSGPGLGSESTLQLGSGISTGFVAGELEIKNPAVVVNGATDISAFIVDENGIPSTASNTVNFESACSIQGLASFTSTNVTTTSGIATTTYIDEGCQFTDTIVATAEWDSTITASGNVTISSTDPIPANTLRIGTGSLIDFVEGEIDVALGNISSDGSTTVSVNLVDANGDLLTSANSVTFTSDCEQLGKANFNSTIVTTSTGTATTTYNASGCVGNDTISATVTIGTTNKIATGSVIVAAANAGSIQFSSASASLIALQGTGSTNGLPENTTITFTVLDGNGAPVSNESVSFSLNSTIGGITLSQFVATSTANGEVTTNLQSGSVATSVRISAVVDSNTLLATTSDAIAIATGPADQNSMSLSASVLNPRAWNRDGVAVSITARLADRFNNPIQDGTAVLFTTELGSIEPTCTTLNGACSVDWISQDPRGTAANVGRTTILATVEGEESFVDANANGVFDGPSDTFTDLAEAYLDENEDGIYQLGEPFVDFDGNTVRSPADGSYNGSGCTLNCSTTNSVTVRDSIVLVMAEDTPVVLAMGTNGFSDNLCNSYASCIAYRFGGASLNTSSVGSLVVTLGGITNEQVLPAGTDITFETTNGKLVGGAVSSVNNTNSPFPNSFFVSFSSDDTESNDGALTLEVAIGDGGAIHSIFLAGIDDSGPIITPPPVIQLGTGTGAGFVNGNLDVTTSNLSSGGQTNVSVNVVDDNGNKVTGLNTVNFSSSCVNSGHSSFTNASVSTTNGTASTTYLSITCSGDDTIIAELVGGTAIASHKITIAPAAAGSIQFTGATSSLIALKATGNTSGTPETSDITFTVLNVLGGPVVSEQVNFSLDSTVGGITLVAPNATTDAAGQVTATLQSGTASTSVRVTATVDNTIGTANVLATSSSAIVIATGPPDQNSFSLSADVLNPQAWNFDGVEVLITARLADRFNNRIQDGTAISFTTELGSINSGCITEDGSCSVTWISQDPRGTAANAGRTTILATVEGEESFIDNDANGVFSNGDTFTDLAEAFVDENEDGIHQFGERYIDFNANGIWDDTPANPADERYNGSSCTHSSLCDTTSSITVRDSIVVIMSEDTPTIFAIGINGFDTDNIDAPTCSIIADCICVEGCNSTSVAGRIYPAFFNITTTVDSITFTIAGSDNGEVLPAGSLISFNSANGSITGGKEQTVGNTNSTNAQYTVFIAPDAPSSAPAGVLAITVEIDGVKSTLQPIQIID